MLTDDDLRRVRQRIGVLMNDHPDDLLLPEALELFEAEPDLEFDIAFCPCGAPLGDCRLRRPRRGLRPLWVARHLRPLPWRRNSMLGGMPVRKEDGRAGTLDALGLAVAEGHDWASPTSHRRHRIAAGSDSLLLSTPPLPYRLFRSPLERHRGLPRDRKSNRSRSHRSSSAAGSEHRRPGKSQQGSQDHL